MSEQDDRPRTEILIRHRVENYELTEGNWHSFIADGNCYMACPEMGIRDLKTDEFVLFQHGNWRHEEMINHVVERLELGWTPYRIVEEWEKIDDA